MTAPTFQRFDTADVLTLEVERDPDEGEYRNAVLNPDGRLGAWGWQAPSLFTVIDGVYRVLDSGSGPWLKLRTAPDQNNFFWSDPIPVTPGTYASGSFRTDNDGAGIYYRGRFQKLDYKGDVIEAGPLSGWHAAGDTFELDRIALENNVYFLRLDINVARNIDGDDIAAPGRFLWVTDVTVLTAPYEHRHDLTHPLPDAPQHYMTDVIGAVTSISISRAPLDANTMTVSILADSLSADDVLEETGYGEGGYGEGFYGGDDGTVIFDGSSLRPGRRAVLSMLAGNWPLFTGEVQSGRVDYDLTQPRGRRARITLVIVDAAQRLASAKKSKAYATDDDIRRTLQGVGVPWDILHNTSSDPLTSTDATTPGASALDQLIRTRDTNAPLMVWVTRDGIVKARYPDDPTDYSDADRRLITDAVYNGNLVVTYDTDRVVNSVAVTLLHGTDSKDYGPFEHPWSVNQWGRHTATYTLVNPGEWTEAEAHEAAEGILTASDTPALVIESAVMPILEESGSLFSEWPFGSIYWATLDLYDPVTVTNTSPDLTYDLLVTGITHTITREKWLTGYSFAAPGRPAMPTIKIR